MGPASLLALLPTWAVVVAVLCGTALVVLVRDTSFDPFPQGSPAFMSGLPYLGAMEFFTDKHGFFARSKAQTKTGSFSFNLGKHRVVGLQGAAARAAFFSSPKLDFAAGYSVLFGNSPKVKDITFTHADKRSLAGDDGKVEVIDEMVMDDDAVYFTKRMTALMKKEKMRVALPDLFKDIEARFDGMGAQGTIDPWVEIYELVFQLTIRTVGARELAADPKQVTHLLHLFQLVDSSATPESIMFPWLPCMAKFRKLSGASRIYMILQKLVDQRKKEGRNEDDALGYLMSEGDSMVQIIRFVIGALFAGILNSGVNAIFVLAYLACDKDLMKRTLKSVEDFAALNTSAPPTASLVEKLKAVPYEAWGEEGIPGMDELLRESIRLHLKGAALRRNVGGRSEPIGHTGEVVPNGAFAAYHIADVHMDPTVYKDPFKFDPDRYAPGREEDKQVPFGYVGWGAGRHPCLGMKFAKLEQTLLIAFFVAKFDFSLVTPAGQPMAAVPNVDLSDEWVQPVSWWQPWKLAHAKSGSQTKVGKEGEFGFRFQAR